MEILQEHSLNINNNSELSELEVIDNFIHNFQSIYGTYHVTFAQKPFRQVISENIFSPSETWRVIALYLHYGGDPFAEKWCKELTSETTISILEESFCVLPWDISYNYHHETLQQTLENNLRFSFNNFFKNQKSGVLFILQLNGIPSVFSVLQGNISSETIFCTLRGAKIFLRAETTRFKEECEIHESQSNIIGSEGFQQNMFEMLGNRDYDCFEHNQMDELKNKIGFALFGLPQKDAYSEKELNQINNIFKTIIEQNEHAKYKNQIIIAFIFNCSEPLSKEKEKRKKNPDYNPDADIEPLPIFVLKKCYSSENDRGCRIFIDHESRVYTSWIQYTRKNRLDECIMVLPKNGCYMGDESGTVLLEKHYSPACKLSSKVAKAADISASGVGLLSVGVVAAAAIPAVTVAPFIITGAAVAGATAGVISVVRSTVSLIDMKEHKQDTNVISSSEARASHINILAGCAGAVGSGANAILSKLISRGANVGRVGRRVVDVINVTNLALGAGALGNSVYHVYFSWKNGDKISSLTILQLGASSLFFANSVYSFKTAATIIEESQANVLKQMKGELQSNNRRKMFDKLHKETIRMNGGDKQAGNAEVISTIHKVPNKDELFKILKANNKLFNKNGVKFSASGTEILFNGKTLDLGSFASLSKTQKLQVLSEMPTAPAQQQAKTTSSLSLTNNITNLTASDVVKLTSFGLRVYTDSTSLNHAFQMILENFSPIIRKSLVEITMAFMGEALKRGLKKIEEFIPLTAEPIIVVMNVVKSFVQMKAVAYKCEYEESKRQARENDPHFDEVKFDEMYGIVHPDNIDRMLFFFEAVVNMMIYKGKVIEQYLDQIFKFFFELVAIKLVYDNQNETREREQQHYKQRKRTSCSICGGYYFIN